MNPAHHPKAEGITERDAQSAALLAAWRARRASYFVAVDPLPPVERRRAERWLVAYRLRASQWITRRIAERTRRAQLDRRSQMRLIVGGRS